MMHAIPEALNQKGLFAFFLAAVFLIILLDFLLSWTLYQFFKFDHKHQSKWMAALRLLYTLFLCYGFLQLCKLLGNPDPVQADRLFQTFQKIWDAGLILFGLHLLLLATLMSLHRRIPKLFVLMTYIAGFSYVLVHTLKVAAPHMHETTLILNNSLGLPMALGELLLAFWLLFRGGK